MAESGSGGSSTPTAQNLLQPSGLVPSGGEGYSRMSCNIKFFQDGITEKLIDIEAKQRAFEDKMKKKIEEHHEALQLR